MQLPGLVRGRPQPLQVVLRVLDSWEATRKARGSSKASASARRAEGGWRVCEEGCGMWLECASRALCAEQELSPRSEHNTPGDEEQTMVCQPSVVKKTRLKRCRSAVEL